MVNCFRCNKQDLQRKDRFVYENRESEIHKADPARIPLVYLCKVCSKNEKILDIEMKKFDIDPQPSFYGQVIDLSKIEGLERKIYDDPEFEQNCKYMEEAAIIVCKIYNKLCKEGKL